MNLTSRFVRKTVARKLFAPGVQVPWHFVSLSLAATLGLALGSSSTPATAWPSSAQRSSLATQEIGAPARPSLRTRTGTALDTIVFYLMDDYAQVEQVTTVSNAERAVSVLLVRTPDEEVKACKLIDRAME